MNTRQLFRAIVVAMGFAMVSGCAVADDTYFLDRHPNIAAADFNAERAIDRMRAAQRANDYDMNGHAANAINLLEQARNEMGAAAQDATR